MAKSSKKVARLYTTDEAIKLHAEAHKSDPFAARHIAKTLHKFPREASDVGAEASVIVNTRKHDQNAFGAFFNTLAGSKLRVEIADTYADRHPAKKRKAYKPRAKVVANRIAA